LNIFKEEALACTLRTVRCGRGYVLVARQTTQCVFKNIIHNASMENG